MRRLLAVAFILFVTTSCDSSQSSRSSAEACSDMGLAAGSDEYGLCMKRIELQRQADLERIRQIRESARRGSNL